MNADALRESIFVGGLGGYELNLCQVYIVGWFAWEWFIVWWPFINAMFDYVRVVGYYYDFEERFADILEHVRGVDKTFRYPDK
jgi:hypothetical protein